MESRMTRQQMVIGSFVIVGFIIITSLIFFFGDTVSDLTLRILENLASAWIVLVTTVVQYVFGSSAGSKDKTNLMSRMAPVDSDECIDLVDEVQR